MLKNNPFYNRNYASDDSKVQKKLVNDITEIKWLIEPAEVVDIILDSKHPLYKTDRDIGNIKIRLINKPPGTQNNADTVIAKPASAYFKKYPLKHEIVAVIKSTSDKAGEVHESTSYYYLDVINIWNGVNSNILPGSSYILNPEQLNKDYTEFTGITSTSNPDEVSIGDTFEKNEDVADLQPYEGDVIHLGRFGQTIRFGSTVKEAKIKNTWSAKGSNGDPIIIIQATKPPRSLFYKIEDINEDSSSIYICDGQSIGLQLPSTSAQSFNLGGTKPTATKEYAGKLITIAADRLVLSAKTDAIIINSKKNIWVSSDNSINLDSSKNIAIASDGPIKFATSKLFDVKSDTNIVLEAPKLNLGANASENAILGNKLVILLTKLLNILITHESTPIPVTTPTGAGVTVPLPTTSDYSSLIAELQTLLSKKVFIE